MRGSFAALEDDGEKRATANATDNGMADDMADVEEGLGGMVTVARFTDPSEGQMAKGALEAAGVEAFLQGENANSLYPGTLGGRLLVRKDDEAEARKILEAAGEIEAEGDEEA